MKNVLSYNFHDLKKNNLFNFLKTVYVEFFKIYIYLYNLKYNYLAN